MRRLFITVAFAGAVLALLSGSSLVKSGNQPFAVLELFTSEGCSSCPPADELLGKYGGRAGIIPLSFHVDYWNSLGWKDPYSSRDFTLRQRNYATALGNDNVYTPQLVVNGEKEFVGSDEAKLEKAVRPLRAGNLLTDLSARAGSKNLEIAYNCQPAAGEKLQLALVLKEVASRVARGENSGRTLTHYNVVTQFWGVKCDPAGKTEIPLPEHFDKARYRLVAFLQQGDSGPVTGALMTEIN